MPAAALTPTNTSEPAPSTATTIPPTVTSIPPTATLIPPTATSIPPTATPVPPTATPVPPTPTPSPTSTPTPVPPTADSSSPVLLDETFDGASLDTEQWTAIAGDGRIELANGAVRLSSAGQTFPFIYTNNNPFPADKNFKITVSMRYLTVTDRGVGFRIGSTIAAYGANQDTARAELFKGRIIEIWQDSTDWHISVGEENRVVYTLPAPELNLHQIEIDYVGGLYRVWLDGREVYVSASTLDRPMVLWFGNPAQVNLAGEWGSLEVSSVSVEILTEAAAIIPTSTPRPPTPTPLPPPPPPTPLGQNCSSGPGNTFAEIWPAYRSRLGCPLTGQQTIPIIAEEAFEGGHTFWRSDTDEIYVIYDRQKSNGADLAEGTWATNPAWKWDGSNPDGIGLTPPAGLYEPKRGFGWLWRTHLRGVDGPLGWALDKEYGFDNTGQIQAFEQGLMVKGSTPKIYILVADGSFYVR
jgi:hypothetical protein